MFFFSFIQLQNINSLQIDRFDNFIDTSRHIQRLLQRIRDSGIGRYIRIDSSALST